MNEIYEKYFVKEYEYDGRVYPDMFCYLYEKVDFTDEIKKELNDLAYSDFSLIDKLNNSSIILSLFQTGILDLNRLTTEFINANIDKKITLNNQPVSFIFCFYHNISDDDYISLSRRGKINLFEKIYMNDEIVPLHKYLYSYRYNLFSKVLYAQLHSLYKDDKSQIYKLSEIYPDIYVSENNDNLVKLQNLSHAKNIDTLITKINIPGYETRRIDFSDLDSLKEIIKETKLEKEYYSNKHFSDFSSSYSAADLETYIYGMDRLNILCGKCDNIIDKLKKNNIEFNEEKINSNPNYMLNFLSPESSEDNFLFPTSSTHYLDSDIKKIYYDLISNLSTEDLINLLYNSLSLIPFYEKPTSKHILHIDYSKLRDLFYTMENFENLSKDKSNYESMKAKIESLNESNVIKETKDKLSEVFPVNKDSELSQNQENGLSKIYDFFQKHNIKVSKEDLSSIAHIKDENTWVNVAKENPYTAGYSDSETNGIYLQNGEGMYETYFHELLHHFSNNIVLEKNSKEIKSLPSALHRRTEYTTGFKKEEFARGLNETITEYIAQTVFPNSKSAYNAGVSQFTKLVDEGIFDKEELINAYFNNDISYLDNKMKELGSSYDSLCSKFSIVSEYNEKSTETKNEWLKNNDKYINDIIENNANMNLKNMQELETKREEIHEKLDSLPAYNEETKKEWLDSIDKYANNSRPNAENIEDLKEIKDMLKNLERISKEDKSMGIKR